MAKVRLLYARPHPFLGKGLSGAYFAIVTLCAAVVVEALAQQWSFIGGFNGLLGIPPLGAPWRSATHGYLTPVENYLFMLAVAVLVFLGLLGVVRSPIGTVLAAIRDNDQRTAFFDEDVSRFKVWAFVVSGLAGGLFVTQFSFVAPSLIGFGLSIEVLIRIAVGGRNVLMAAFLGALLVRSVEGALSDRLGNFWLLVLGVLFVVTVVLMPNGLLDGCSHSPRPGGFVTLEPPSV
jgi:branched-chain amino acid transport system permease protein/urea transport system permease protein